MLIFLFLSTNPRPLPGSPWAVICCRIVLRYLYARLSSPHPLADLPFAYPACLRLSFFFVTSEIASALCPRPCPLNPVWAHPAPGLVQESYDWVCRLDWPVFLLPGLLPVKEHLNPCFPMCCIWVRRLHVTHSSVGGKEQRFLFKSQGAKTCLYWDKYRLHKYKIVLEIWNDCIYGTFCFLSSFWSVGSLRLIENLYKLLCDLLSTLLCEVVSLSLTPPHTGKPWVPKTPDDLKAVGAMLLSAPCVDFITLPYATFTPKATWFVASPKMWVYSLDHLPCSHQKRCEALRGAGLIAVSVSFIHHKRNNH